LVRARAGADLPLRATFAGRSDVSAHALALRLAEAVDDTRRVLDIRLALAGETREVGPAEVFEGIGAILCGGPDRREWSDPRDPELEAEIGWEWAEMLRMCQRERTGGGSGPPDEGAGFCGVRLEGDSLVPVGNALTGTIMLGGGRVLNHYRRDVKIVRGDRATVCDRAEPKIPPEMAETIAGNHRDAGRLKPGQTIHWVGRQTEPMSVCCCRFDEPAAAPVPADAEARQETPNVVVGNPESRLPDGPAEPSSLRWGGIAYNLAPTAFRALSLLWKAGERVTVDKFKAEVMNEQEMADENNVHQAVKRFNDAVGKVPGFPWRLSKKGLFIVRKPL
jgi:hypothetical protein